MKVEKKIYRRYRCGVFVGDENVRQVEDAAQHDEADAVRDGGGHGEEVPKAVPLQHFSLLQHLLSRHLRLQFVAALAVAVPADAADERPDAPGVVRVSSSRGWRREQVGRAQCTRRCRRGCCSSGHGM